MTPRRSGLVLVVDDDLDVRESLAEVLEDVGYHTLGAGNGEEALATLRAAPTLPCVILLDIMMPVMDGWQFRAAQQQDPRLAAVPVVVITAHADPGEGAEELNAAEHLRKPIKVERLLAAIARFCGAEG